LAPVTRVYLLPFPFGSLPFNTSQLVHALTPLSPRKFFSELIQYLGGPVCFLVPRFSFPPALLATPDGCPPQLWLPWQTFSLLGPHWRRAFLLDLRLSSSLFWSNDGSYRPGLLPLGPPQSVATFFFFNTSIRPLYPPRPPFFFAVHVFLRPYLFWTGLLLISGPLFRQLAFLFFVSGTCTLLFLGFDDPCFYRWPPFHSQAARPLTTLSASRSLVTLLGSLPCAPLYFPSMGLRPSFGLHVIPLRLPFFFEALWRPSPRPLTSLPRPSAV